MKDEILNYLAGLCQASAAALLASGIIIPSMRIPALFACYVCAMMGLLFVYLKNKGD